MVRIQSHYSQEHWIVPLCLVKEPKHWIMTWIDYTRSKIGIFDSIPELGLSSCAEPVCIHPKIMTISHLKFLELLLEIVDHIWRALNQDPVEWDSGCWKRVLEKPLSLQCQIDSWSCGYYILMRIRAVAKGTALEDARFDQRDMVQKEAVNILLGLPWVIFQQTIQQSW